MVFQCPNHKYLIPYLNNVLDLSLCGGVHKRKQLYKLIVDTLNCYLGLSLSTTFTIYCLINCLGDVSFILERLKSPNAAICRQVIHLDCYIFTFPLHFRSLPRYAYLLPRHIKYIPYKKSLLGVICLYLQWIVYGI